VPPTSKPNPDANRPDPAASASTAPPGDAGKGRPTPKRKTAEAANKRPLVTTDRKGAAKVDRARAKEQRSREYQALQSGDERYLPVKDRGPLRRYIRDYVDARWNLGELFLPVAFILLITQMLTSSWAYVTLSVLGALYLYVLATIVDAFIMWRGLKKRLRAKFGADAEQRGLTMYAVLRVFQIRRARLPKPQVKHGQRPA
jgi:hypothetical protein